MSPLLDGIDWSPDMEPFVPQRIKKKKGEKGFSKDANVLQRENLLEVDKGSNSSLEWWKS